jgi:hypothetical protein
MATDGANDYRQLMEGVKTIPQDSLSVLQDTMLVLLLLIQMGLNASSLQWRTIMYDFLDHCFSTLKGYNHQYRFTFSKIISMGIDYKWCEPRNAQSNSA